MRLLAIDTTGEFCSAALRQIGADDIIVSERIGRGHAERLAPMVEAVLKSGECAPGQIDRIGVTTGPGSFAGVRVGVAFARGLSLAIGAEAVGVSTLAVWANMGDFPELDDVWAVHDARRGDLVLQHFSRGTAQGEPEVKTIADTAARFAAQSPGQATAFTGAGAALARLAMDAAPNAEADLLDLSVLLDLTASAPKPDRPPSPFYARPPDAKLPGGASL